MGTEGESGGARPVGPEAAQARGNDPDAVRIRSSGPPAGPEPVEQDLQSEPAAVHRVDRIAEPWGTRTPYGPGEEWPVRVDQFLEEGISEEEVDRWAQTASLHHSDGDGLDLAIKDGRIVGVRAVPW